MTDTNTTVDLGTVWNQDLPWAAIRDGVKQADDATLDDLDGTTIEATFDTDTGIWDVTLITDG